MSDDNKNQDRSAELVEATDFLLKQHSSDSTEWLNVAKSKYPAVEKELDAIGAAINATKARSADDRQKGERQSKTERVLGDYHIHREIGRGGMGIVYKAWKESLDKTVAIKVLPLAGSLDERSLIRFHNEAKAAAQLEHPNIIPVMSVEKINAVDFYVMPLIEGNNLSELIKSIERKSSWSTHDPDEVSLDKDTNEKTDEQAEDTVVLPRIDIDGSSKKYDLRHIVQSRRPTFDARYIRIAVHLIAQVADALQHAHDRGIVHRDIKPSNLILDYKGTIWVTDFGLAQIRGQNGLTMTGDMVGTLRYMSPEQALAKHVVVDHRTDVYSLGLTLYELLTLQPAFNGRDAAEVLHNIAFQSPTPIRRTNKNVPKELETIVHKAISRSPDERYQTAQEFADDLVRYQTDQPIQARPPSLFKRAEKWARRHRVISMTALAVVLMTALFGVIGTAVLWKLYVEKEQLLTETEVARDLAKKQVRKSESMRLLAESVIVRDTNPGLAKLLAVEARNWQDSSSTRSAILDSTLNCRELKAIDVGYPVKALDWSPNGALLAIAQDRSPQQNSTAGETEAGRILILNASSGDVLGNYDMGHSVSFVRFDPSEQFLITASDSRSNVAIRRLNDGQLRKLEDSLLASTRWGIMHPNGETILTLSPDREELLIVSLTDSLASPQGINLDGRISEAYYSPTGGAFVTVTDDLIVTVWSTSDLSRIAAIDLSDTTNESSRKEIVASWIDESRSMLMTDCRHRGVEYWKLNDYVEPFVVHPSMSQTIILDNGRTILRRPDVTTVRAIDAISGEVQFERKFDSTVRSFIRGRDGRRAVILCADNNAYVFDSLQKQITSELLGHEAFISAASFSVNLQQIATGSYDHTVRLWSERSAIRELQCDTSLDQSSDRLFAASVDGSYFAIAKQIERELVAFSSDGKARALSGTVPYGMESQGRYIGVLDGEAGSIIDVESGVLIRSISLPLEQVTSVDCNSNGSIVAVTTQQGRVVAVADGENSKAIELVRYDHPVSDLIMLGDGERVIYFVKDPKDLHFEIWSLVESKSLGRVDMPNSLRFNQVSPDESKVLAVSPAGRISVFDTRTGEITRSISNVDATLPAYFLGETSDRILYRDSNSRELRILDTDSNTYESNPTILQVVQAREYSVDSTGRYLCAAIPAGTKLFDILSGQSWLIDSDPNHAFAFCPSGKRLACARRPISSPAARDRFSVDIANPPKFDTIQIYDLDELSRLQSLTRSVARTIELESGGVDRLMFATNEQLIGTIRYHPIEIVDGITGGVLRSCRHHGAAISRLQFAADNRTLYSSSWDGNIVKWDARTARNQQTIKPNLGPIQDARLISGDSEIAVRPKGSHITVIGLGATIGRRRELDPGSDILGIEVDPFRGKVALLHHLGCDIYSQDSNVGESTTIADAKGIAFSKNSENVAITFEMSNNSPLNSNATDDEQPTVKIMDEQLNTVATYHSQSSPIDCFFTANSQTLLIVHSDGQIAYWEWETDLTHRFEVKGNGSIHSAQISNDSALLLLGTSVGAIVWDVDRHDVHVEFDLAGSSAATFGASHFRRGNQLVHPDSDRLTFVFDDRLTILPTSIDRIGKLRIDRPLTVEERDRYELQLLED